MIHTIIGYTKREKSTIYYLVCDDDQRPSTSGQTCSHVFVPLSHHTPSDVDIGKSVRLTLRKVGGKWFSDIDFEN